MNETILKSSPKYCLATVSDDNFLVGTQVLLHTFLKHNPWFGGDLKVITKSVTKRMRDGLNGFKNLSFHLIDPRLENQLAQLVQDLSYIDSVQKRFYSVEAFRLEGYEKVIYLDSDMICRGSLEELLTYDEALVCCPDVSFYRDMGRSLLSFMECNRSNEASDSVIDTSFNSGLLVIDFSRIRKSTYQNLLNEIIKEEFYQVTTGHTDQYLYNVFFRHSAYLVSGKFNFLTKHADLILEKEKIGLEEVVMLHFARNPKPWKWSAIFKKWIGGKSYGEYYRLWWRAYLGFGISTNKVPFVVKVLIRLFLYLHPIPLTSSH